MGREIVVLLVKLLEAIAAYESANRRLDGLRFVDGRAALDQAKRSEIVALPCLFDESMSRDIHEAHEPRIDHVQTRVRRLSLLDDHFARSEVLDRHIGQQLLPLRLRKGAERRRHLEEGRYSFNNGG